MAGPLQTIDGFNITSMTHSAKCGRELDEMFGAAKILPQIRALGPEAAQFLPRMVQLFLGQPITALKNSFKTLCVLHSDIS